MHMEPRNGPFIVMKTPDRTGKCINIRDWRMFMSLENRRGKRLRVYLQYLKPTQPEDNVVETGQDFPSLHRAWRAMNLWTEL